VDPTPVHGLEGLTWPSDDYTYEMLDSSLMERHGESNPDLVCTLGGDGLLLYASMLFPGPCPPILCVAGGSLGFLTLFTRDEMVDAIKDSLGLLCNRQDMQSMSFYPSASSSMYDGKSQRAESKTTLGLNNCIRISMRMRLNVIVTNQEGIVQARYNVLNEVVIDRARSPYLASLECFVDDVHMTTVQGDGIIFSTPTGSTAYSMSAGMYIYALHNRIYDFCHANRVMGL
jgi:NAD+ kinase